MRMRTWVPLRAWALVLAAMSVTAAGACGLEDASAVAVQRIAMNLAFPGAASVLEATQAAQRSGVLPRARVPVAEHSAEDEAQAERALAQATARFQALPHPLGATRPGVSIVLLRHMLWSRLASQGDRMLAEMPAEGPRPGDVVLVADTPVLDALARRRIDFARAVELGLVRMYGPADATRLAAQWLAGGAAPQAQSPIVSTGARS